MDPESTDQQPVSEEYLATKEFYANLNTTIRCFHMEQYRAYLRCPLCRFYGVCEQLTDNQRSELEASPFVTVGAIEWIGPERRKTMYIAVLTDGALKIMEEGFDPKEICEGEESIEKYKDIEEILVVSKAFRRKVSWVSVSVNDVLSGMADRGQKQIQEGRNRYAGKRGKGTQEEAEI